MQFAQTVIIFKGELFFHRGQLGLDNIFPLLSEMIIQKLYLGYLCLKSNVRGNPYVSSPRLEA